MSTEESLKRVLLVALGLFSVSVFFTQTGIGVFGLSSLVLLLVWRYALGYEPARQIPMFLIIVTTLFALDILLGASLSDNHAEGFMELRKYWNILLCGLLFTAPLSSRHRRAVVIVFLTAASLAGLLGIFQYFGIIVEAKARAHGLAHPIHYATNLSFALGAALMMIFIRNDIFPRSGKSLAFLSVVVLTTFLGLLYSQSRGVWIAFLLSSIITLLLYNVKKAVVLAGVLLMVLMASFAASENLRGKAVSIVTSIHAEDERGSTGNRLELWKGALLIFRDSPLMGTGTGDYVEDIEGLISGGGIRDVPFRVHAHNIYLQWFSTQGAIGLLSLLALLASLMVWAIRCARAGGNAGGYVMAFSTLIIITGGMTENSIGISKIFSAYCLTMGLFGGYGHGECTGNGS